MVDASIKDYPEAEVLTYIKVGLSCTQAAPGCRPTMRQVVKMLTRPAAIQDLEMRPATSWPAETSTDSGSITYSEIVPR